jgi:hypothetical protein
MRNTQIEKSLDCKMRPRYLGPLIVIERNNRGASVLCELNSSVLHRPVAAFCILPYLARKSIPLAPNFLDIDLKGLDELRTTDEVDEDIRDLEFDLDED